MSDDAYKLIRCMCTELSPCPYIYEMFFGASYDTFVINRGFNEPEEGREFVIGKVKEVLEYYA
jgi:hypothetical protein